MPKLPTGGIWDQYNNPATEPPLNIGSQDFEPGLNTLDDQAADDFVLTAPPPPMFVYITGVRVMGEYSAGGGPASSFNVYFYTNGAGNLPGTLVASFLNRSYTGTPPDFVINWTPFSLPSGTYWVSVQARQDFNTNGQWFWHNRTVQSNAGAAWQNPGDGYGTGCTTWNRKNACMPDQVWPDQVFRILGFFEGPTPTATPTPTCCQYMPTTATGTIVPGTTDTGNHCDDCTTSIPLPFPITLYGVVTYNQLNVGSNGNLQTVTNSGYSGVNCPLPDPNLLGMVILPYQDNLRTDQVADCSSFASGCGIFTSVTATAPNRQFNIEWRAAYSGRAGTANFEVRFYESNSTFDVIYGSTVDNGLSEESGIQGGACPSTTFSCHTANLTNRLKVTYSCGAPFTPTPTPTPTATLPPPTPTATPTATPISCHVTNTTPVCGSLVSGSPPTDFIVSLSGPVDPTTVQGSDFTVNDIAANAFALLNGNMTIVFHFNTTPVMQGLNTMHIPAGAFNCGNGPVAEFTCTFTYQASTPTATPTATLPPTPTPTPTAPARPTRTPRPRPTPAPRP